MAVAQVQATPTLEELTKEVRRLRSSCRAFGIMFAVWILLGFNLSTFFPLLKLSRGLLWADGIHADSIRTGSMTAQLDEQGNDYASLSVSKNTGPQLLMSSQNGAPYLFLHAGEGAAGMQIKDSGRMLVELSVPKGGAPQMRFMDRQGKVIWSAP